MDQDSSRLASRIRSVHEQEPVPPFDAVWRKAAARAVQGRSPQRWHRAHAFAFAAGLALLATASIVVLRARDTRLPLAASTAAATSTVGVTLAEFAPTTDALTMPLPALWRSPLEGLHDDEALPLDDLATLASVASTTNATETKGSELPTDFLFGLNIERWDSPAERDVL